MRHVRFEVVDYAVNSDAQEPQSFDIIGTHLDGEEEFLVGLSFQDGPIKECGVNGIDNEILLEIVYERLKTFHTMFPKDSDTKRAKECVAMALVWLNNRTSKREQRGVEGTSVQ